MKQVGKRFDVTLKKALRENDRSIRSIAIEANVSPTSAQKFVRGQYDITLRLASSLAEVVLPSWNSTTKFLHGTDETTDCLSHMIHATLNELQVIGTELIPFGDLEDAVAKGAKYQRILTGEYVPNRLIKHLKRATCSSNTEVYHTPARYYQSMTITDGEVLLLMPSAKGIYGGIYFSGDDFQQNYSMYFQEILHDNRTQKVTSCYRK